MTNHHITGVDLGPDAVRELVGSLMQAAGEAPASQRVTRNEWATAADTVEGPLYQVVVGEVDPATVLESATVDTAEQPLGAVLHALGQYLVARYSDCAQGGAQ